LSKSFYFYVLAKTGTRAKRY